MVSKSGDYYDLSRAKGFQELLPYLVLNIDFLPFYAILRAIPSKLGGVSAMLGALLIFLSYHRRLG